MSFLYPCFWGTSTSWSTGYTAQCHLCLLLVSHSPLLGNWSGLRLSVTVVSPSPHWSRSSRCPSSPQPLSLSCCPSILWSWNFLVTFLSCSKTFNCPSHAEKTKTRHLSLRTRSHSFFPNIFSTIIGQAPFALAMPPHSLFPKCTQNAKRLCFAHTASFAWRGGPCISTNKLKVSFRS